MQLLYKMGAWITGYAGTKSGQRTAKSTVQSPLRAAANLAVQWPDFMAKSRAAGDAKNTTKDRESSTAFPGTHTYI